RIRLDEATALAIMAGVARGLREAHERGIIHRDIKPANILLLQPPPAAATALDQTAELLSGSEPKTSSRSGSSAVKLPPIVAELPSAGATPEAVARERAELRIKISDFGLARHVIDTESMALTSAGALLGTPHYMAPEQWTGRGVDPRTDVYAMGATLYHLLAGRPPFGGASRDALAAMHCNAPPPPLPATDPPVSEGIVRVVERAMAKDPADRYADAGAMLRDLEALLHGEPTGIPMHPILPACDPARVLRFEFRWDL